jgi:hypothetical protein
VINTGTIGNAYTTAASSNGASTIVARDASGNFTANNVTATYIIADGTTLTALNASTLSAGTIPDARFPATLPAVSGANLTSLNASNISSGTVGTARLASGTANSSTYLRGDSTWAALSAPNNGTLSMATSGTGLSGSATFTADSSSNVTFTVTSNASSANGASTIVARDASGNFSANTITATLSGSATSATTATTATQVSNALTAGTGITYSSGTTYNGSAAITISIPQAVGTASNVQFGSFGVGTAASGTTGEIRATNNVTAFYASDNKWKENVQEVDGALAKVCAIGSKTFDWTDAYLSAHGGEDGYFIRKSDFGVIAQDVQAVFPQAVRTREDGTLAVDYEKLATLAFGAIKELVKRVEALEAK